MWNHFTEYAIWNKLAWHKSWWTLPNLRFSKLEKGIFITSQTMCSQVTHQNQKDHLRACSSQKLIRTSLSRCIQGQARSLLIDSFTKWSFYPIRHLKSFLTSFSQKSSIRKIFVSQNFSMSLPFFFFFLVSLSSNPCLSTLESKSNQKEEGKKKKQLTPWVPRKHVIRENKWKHCLPRGAESH